MPRIQPFRLRAEMSASEEGVGNVYISGPITSWAWQGLNETDSVQVRNALNDVKDATTLNVYIDSPGGYLEESKTMMRLIKEHGAQIKNAYCMECASAATLLCLPCNRVYAYQGAEFLFHNPRGSMYGTADEIINYGEGLKKTEKGVAELYAGRMNKTVEEIQAMMDKETWATAQEAMDMGFVDGIIPIAPDDGFVMSAESDAVGDAIMAKLLGYQPHNRKNRPMMLADGNPPTSAGSNNGANAGKPAMTNNKEGQEKKMTMQELMESDRALYDEVYNAGMTAERQRIQDIDALSTPENAEMIQAAKYEEGKMCNARDLAYELMVAQRTNPKPQSKGASYMSRRQNEANGMRQVTGGAAEDNDEGAEQMRAEDRYAGYIGEYQRSFGY